MSERLGDAIVLGRRTQAIAAIRTRWTASGFTACAVGRRRASSSRLRRYRDPITALLADRPGSADDVPEAPARTRLPELRCRR